MRGRSGSWFARLPCAVLGDVQADEPGLALAHVRVRLLQRRLAVAQRLHLGPGQHEAGLDLVEEVVVVPRAAVVDDQLFSRASPSGRSVGSAPWSITLAQLNEAGRGVFPGLARHRVRRRRGRRRARADASSRDEAPARRTATCTPAAVVALADTACGYGCILSLPEGATGFTTIELKTNFLRTRAGGDDHVRGAARARRPHDAALGRDRERRRTGARWRSSAARSSCCASVSAAAIAARHEAAVAERRPRRRLRAARRGSGRSSDRRSPRAARARRARRRPPRAPPPSRS